MQPRLPGLKGFRGALGSRGTRDGEHGPSWATPAWWGSPERAPGQGTGVAGVLGHPLFWRGCQRVLVPVQEPPARTCWPPAPAAPARTAASAGSQKTTRASPAVAPLAGKVGARPVSGFSTPRSPRLLGERQTEGRERGWGAVGRWLPARPARREQPSTVPGPGEGPVLPHGSPGWMGHGHRPHSLARVLSCPTAHPGECHAAIARTPWQGQFAARASPVQAVPKMSSSSSPGLSPAPPCPRGPRPPLSRRSDLRDRHQRVREEPLPQRGHVPEHQRELPLRLQSRLRRPQLRHRHRRLQAQ